MLADEYFWLVHDDRTGKARLHGRAVGLGLAAALLAELMWQRRITAQDERVIILDETPPDDVLAHHVLNQLVTHAQLRTVPASLDFFSRTSVADVGERLQLAGHVRREVTRRLFHDAVRWMPTDVNRAAWPMARLSTSLRRSEPLNQADGFLACLVAVSGLDEYLVRGAPGSVERLRVLVASAPPPLSELLTYTQAAVGSAVQAGRG